MTLGPYPRLSMADAREVARDALNQAAMGQDPASRKKVERAAETFGELAALYMEKHAKPRKRSWREDERTLNHDVLPRWKNVPAKAITRRDVRELLEQIVERGAPIQANRTLAIVRRLFNFAIEREVVDVNPCQAIRQPAPSRQRDRVLSTAEIRALWRAADDCPVGQLYQLYLLTAQRGGELRMMRWEEVDLDGGMWTIPAERSKNRLPHRVPLSSQALAILRRLRETANGSPWVFPGRMPDEPLTQIQGQLDKLRAAAGVDFKPHDLRRTAASHMTSIGISRLTVGKILNHVEQGVTAIYDRHSYDREKQEALNAWARRLHAIVTGESAAKVVELRR
jgi:integrase